VERDPVTRLTAALSGKAPTRRIDVGAFDRSCHLIGLGSLADSGEGPIWEAALLVADQYQRCGVGRALVDAMADFALRRGVEQVRVLTTHPRLVASLIPPSLHGTRPTYEGSGVFELVLVPAT